MNKKNGFSLLSFIVYMVLFSLSSFFICQVITSLVLPTIIKTRHIQSLITLHCACDLFVRDIHAAKQSSFTIRKITEHEIIFAYKDQCIGWLIENDYLKRKEGLFKNNIWKSSTTSIVNSKVTGTFKLIKHNEIPLGISMIITPLFFSEKKLECFVALC